jgi:hypothetical protein
MSDRPDIYLTKKDTHKGQTSVTLAGFESTIPVSELPQTHNLERAATVISQILKLHLVSRAVFFLRQLVTCFQLRPSET